jgi:hypothetical protein
MFLYIELWKPKDAWLKLSTEERRAKLDHLRREAESHPIPGVIPFSFRQVGDVFLLDSSITQPAIIDDAVARPTGYRYAAAWMIPTKELIKKFEQRVENLGWWFEFFDQKNAWGEMDAQATLADMIGAAPRAASTSETPKGRFGRTRYAVRRLRHDMDELKEGVNVMLDYVKTEQSKS